MGELIHPRFATRRSACGGPEIGSTTRRAGKLRSHASRDRPTIRKSEGCNNRALSTGMPQWTMLRSRCVRHLRSRTFCSWLREAAVLHDRLRHRRFSTPTNSPLNLHVLLPRLSPSVFSAAALFSLSACRYPRGQSGVVAVVAALDFCQLSSPNAGISSHENVLQARVYCGRVQGRSEGVFGASVVGALVTKSPTGCCSMVWAVVTKVVRSRCRRRAPLGRGSTGPSSMGSHRAGRASPWGVAS